MTDIWLGYLPAGSSIPVEIDGTTTAGAAILAAARRSISKERKIMAASAAVPRPPIRATVSPEVFIIEEPSFFSRVGGWFSGAFGWIRDKLTASTNWAKSIVMKGVDALHLRPVGTFIKTAARNFGVVGWTATGVGLVTTGTTRRWIGTAITWVADHVVEYTVDLLHFVRLTRVANWLDDGYVALRARVSTALTWVGDLWGGKVRRFFDTNGWPMRFISSAAWIVAATKAWLMIPMVLPLRLIAGAVGLAILGLYFADMRGKSVKVKASVEIVDGQEGNGALPMDPKAVQTMAENMVEDVAKAVQATEVDDKTPPKAPTAKAPTQRRDYPARPQTKRRPPTGK